MSTILKALKKAEDGRAKETLPGKITIEETPENPERSRTGFKIAAAVLLPALAAAALYTLYPSIIARVRALRPAAPAAKPAPAALRTPAPPPTAAEEAPPLRLSGVIWDKENPIAIVNGKSVSTGEELSGARVVRITVESVTFSRGGKVFTLTVHE